MAVLEYKENLTVTLLGNDTEKYYDTIKLYGREAVGILDVYTLRLNKESSAYNSLMAEGIPSEELIYFSLITNYTRWPLMFQSDKKFRRHLGDKGYIVTEDELINKEQKMNFGPECVIYPNEEEVREYMYDTRIESRDQRTCYSFNAKGESFVYLKNDGTKQFFKMLNGYDGSRARVMQITKGQFMLDNAVNGRFEAIMAAEPTEEEINLLLSAFELAESPEHINIEQVTAFEKSLMTEQERINYPKGKVIKQLCELADQQNFIAEKAKKLKPVA